MDKDMTSGKDPVINPDAQISAFKCSAKVGIGYAFWMKIRYKEPGGIWVTSEKGDSVALGQTGTYDISKKLPDLIDGSLVQLDIQVRAGSSNVYAESCFVYKKDSKVAALYNASGTTFNAAVTYEECVPK